jgi:hypothetical protein
MDSVEKDLRLLVKELARLSRKADSLAKKMAKASKPKKKPAKKPAKKKASKVTAIDAVYNVISRSSKGATTAQIKAKTGFPEIKIWNNINRLKKLKKVQSKGRGLYMKAS